MPHVARFIIGLAALMFVGVSATMNALFLSSLGRTSVEAGLLAAISLAADITKLALPVALLRAASQKAWAEMSAAALMLTGVTALSLASGLGFTALTREAAQDARAAHADAVAARRADLQRIAAQLAAIETVRTTNVLTAEIAAARRDRKWQLTQSCSAPTTSAGRVFCAEIAKLETALAEAGERNRLEGEQRQQRAALEALTAAGSSVDADPQATAIAALLGIERSWPRVALVSSLTVILEVGSVLLVLLATGAALRVPRPLLREPEPFRAAEVPMQADRSHWLRQRLHSEGTWVGQSARDDKAG